MLEIPRDLVPQRIKDSCTLLRRKAAFWGSWADAMHMIHESHPDVAARVVAGAMHPGDAPNLGAAARGGCSTSTSASWPKSKLAEVEIGRSRSIDVGQSRSQPNSWCLLCFFLLYFFLFSSFSFTFSFSFLLFLFFFLFFLFFFLFPFLHLFLFLLLFFLHLNPEP